MTSHPDPVALLNALGYDDAAEAFQRVAGIVQPPPTSQPEQPPQPPQPMTGQQQREAEGRALLESLYRVSLSCGRSGAGRVRPADLFPAAKSTSAKKLVQLGQRHDELRVEARDLQAQAAATSPSRGDPRELREAEARQHAFGDAASRIKAVKTGLHKLKSAGAERADAARIVRDAEGQVAAEIRRHAREHSAELWSELTKDAAPRPSG